MVNLFRSLGVAGWAWRSTLSVSPRIKIWLSFLLVAACQFVALWWLLSFHLPEFLPITLPIMRLFGGDAVTHYPAFFFFLPHIFSRLSLVIAVLVASMAVGVATLYFAHEFGHHRDQSPWKAAARRYPALLVLTGILAVALLAISELRGLIPTDLLRESLLARWIARGGMLLLFVLAQSFFAYGTAWVVLRDNSAFAAIRNSVLVTARIFLPTLIVVALPALLLFPLTYLAGRVDLFVTKLRPETVVAILTARVVAEVFLSFLVVGAITRLFLWRAETAR